MRRCYRHGGCVDFNVRMRFAQHPESYGSMGDLKAIAVDGEFRKTELGIGADADQIRGIELHLAARFSAGRHSIIHHQGSIDGGCNPIARVAAADRHFTIDDTDASYSTLRRTRVLRWGRILSRRGS